MDGTIEECKEMRSKNVSRNTFNFTPSEVENDDVFESDDNHPPSPCHQSSPLFDKSTELFGKINDMAIRMSETIVTSSLPSSSPGDVADVTIDPIIECTIDSNISVQILQDECKTSKDWNSQKDDDSNDEVTRKNTWNPRDTFEEWESETSDSGSYVIESSGHVAHPPASDLHDNVRDAMEDTPLQNVETLHDRSLDRCIDLQLKHVDKDGVVISVDESHKSASAIKRLVDLIILSEPFRTQTNIKGNEMDRRTRTVGIDNRDSEEMKAKSKLERWNFRLDQLLIEIKKTNKSFIENFCNNGQIAPICEVVEEKTFPVVEFNRGLHCTDVIQAHDILTTRYKLGDIKKRKSLISWSKWNVGHVVRGPHSQSPIWKPGFLEEVKKSRNIIEELNKSIESRELILKKLSDNQTIDYYTGLVMRCFERQQSNPGLLKDVEDQSSTIKPHINTPVSVNKRTSTVDCLGTRSTSLSQLASAPHQPQHSNHIKCFVLNDVNRGYETLPASTNSKPSIMDFLNQTNQTHHQDKLKSTSISSKISDEGYDDVFCREEDFQEPQKNILTQCLSRNIHHKSQPLLNYCHNSQSLQKVSQQHRNKMKKKSQQRQRQIRNKLEASFPGEYFDYKTASGQQNTSTYETKSSRQTLNCLANQSEVKFNSLRIKKNPPTIESCKQCSNQPPNDQEPISKTEGANVFTKFYHWFHGKFRDD